MTSRRDVIKAVGVGAIAAALPMSAKSYARILGANDRMQVAVMGIRSRGKALIFGFAGQGADVTHIVDVDSEVIGKVSGEMSEKGLAAPTVEKDVRIALESSDLDALVVATPDHWHTPAALMALDAGKHVYLEKPASHNAAEGEMLVAAQKKHGHVVQMGNQQRSSIESMELVQAIRDGELGDVYHAYTWYANNRGSIGNGTQITPPDRLDWELWQGPAPRRTYQDNVVHYDWHWFWHWGTGETCNNAAHELDIARWAMGLGHPEAVSAVGARRFHTDDDWEMYDTLELRLTYPGDKSIIWDAHSCNKVLKFGRSRGTCLYGTKGSAIVDRQGFEIYDVAGNLVRERKVPAAATNSADLVGAGALTDAHIKNFIETVRGTASRQASPIDEGVVSTLMCHLGNISYRAGRTLEVNPETGRVKGRFARRYWGRDYEPGWELKV